MIKIIVHPAEDSTVIPNVITPNGDGFNDKLMLKNMIKSYFSAYICNASLIQVYIKGSK